MVCGRLARRGDKPGNPARLAAIPLQGIGKGPMADPKTSDLLAPIQEPHRRSLEAGLRRINSARLENRLDKDACMREAFDEIAKTIRASGESLSEEVLTGR